VEDGGTAELVTDYNEFLKLHRLLEDSFPLVHSSKHISKTVVNKHSLLFEWVGTDTSLPSVTFVLSRRFICFFRYRL
jgi:hypothetical protein